MLPCDFDQNNGRQAFHFALVNAFDNNPNKQYKAHIHLKSHHDAMYVVDMEGAPKKNISSHETLWFKAILAWRRPFQQYSVGT